MTGSDLLAVSRQLDRINAAWTEGRPAELNALFHESIVMVYPGFAGRAEGRAAVLAGFEDFCTNARLHRFDEADRQIDVIGNAAVASFAFDLIYEREERKYRSTGRDVWIFERSGDRWLAVWRTLLDLSEEPAGDA